MRNTIILLLAILLSIPTAVKASHLKGGEITWRCLPSGKYQFYLEIYRECAGVSFTFNNQTINVSGGASLSAITVKPDINRFNLLNQGNISPKGAGGCQKSCFDNPDKGVTQMFPFISDPVTLSGVPPASGWVFSWGGSALPAACCRPTVTNLVGSSGDRYFLRAIMYPYQGKNADPCYDSSPRFMEIPAVIICKSYPFVFNHNASDMELDSLVYSWDKALSTGMNDPVTYNTAMGYNFNSPTPGKQLHPDNEPATLDPQTGEMTMTIHSGGTVEEYTTCVRVDAYRCGKKIASIFRDIPFVLNQCPGIPGTGAFNNPPVAKINGIFTQGFVDTVYAGEKVVVPFQSLEYDFVYTDPNDPSTAQVQSQTLSPTGFMFSNDYADPTDCLTKGVAPCATLTPPPVPGPDGRLVLSAQTAISTLFEWQTSCNHLANTTLNGCASTSGRYTFVMKTYDDHCPLPAVNYPSLSIRVLAPPTVPAPEIHGVSVELDGSVTLSYKKPPPPNGTLDKYQIQMAITPNATAAPTWSETMIFEDSTNNFDGPYNTLASHPYTTMNNDVKVAMFKLPPPASTPPILWEQDPDVYTYLRMKSFSGCGGDQQSNWSSHVRVPRAEHTHVGPAGALNSKTKITWDLPRNPASNQLPSASKFYRIWVNYPVNTINDVQDPSKWVLLATTKNQEFTIQNALTCNERIAARVEIRDTLANDSVISFFTSVTSFVMNPPLVNPTPVIDSVSVDANGDVYVGITPGRPASKHEIWDVTNGTPGTLIATLWDPILDTLLDINGAANTGSRKYKIVAFDKCDPTASGESVTHNTIYIDPATSELLDTCAGKMKLDWNAYVGWPTNNNKVTYEVLYSTTGLNGPYTEVGTTPNTEIFHNGVLGETDYWYKVIARDEQGHRSTSAIYFVNHGKKPSSDVVDAPVLLCARVLENGSVEVDWETPDDPTKNRRKYVFEYNATGSWQSLATINDTSLTTRLFTQLNGNTSSIKIRARTYSDSCETLVPSAYSDVLETIHIDAVYQVDQNGATIYNAGEAFWNSIPLDSTNQYTLERKFVTQGGGSFQFINNTFNTHYVDPGAPGAGYCDTNVQYRVKIPNPNAGCLNISNVDEINYLDNFDPNMQPIDYISYDRVTGELIVKWSVKPLGSPDVDSVALVVPDPTDPTQFDEIVRVDWDDLQIRTLHPLTDASIDVKSVTLQAIDMCGRDSKEFDVHTTIDVDAAWDTCAQTFSLNWNAYETFRTSGDVTYSIFYSEDGDNYLPIGNPVNDTVFTGSIPNFLEAHTYHFYIEARDGSGNYFSRSNVDSILTLVENMPEFTYLRTATVNAPNQVQIDGFVDDQVAVSRYNILRGQFRNELFRVGTVLPTDVDDKNFSYIDHTAATNELSYYYSIQVQSPCGNYLDSSNVGRTILLNVTADHERVANILTWNAYEEWDSTVAYYNIYRGVDGVFDFMNVYETVVPTDPNVPLQFVDDLSDERYSLGQFCYTIEAVEGPVIPELASYITSSNSKSNYACADAEPLFYIPNAFSPSGVNKVFRPEGQFIDFAFYEMIIYNRWGEKVFETREFFEGWDGTYEGESAQDGTYVYTIRFKGADGREHSKKGTVTLIN